MASPQSGKAGSAVSPVDPNPPHDADKADPGAVEKVKAQQEENRSGKYGEVKVKPYEKDPSKSSWIEIKLMDEARQPVPGKRYEITLPDQSVATGTLDQNGFARIDGIDPGTCEVTFPDLDKSVWKKK